MVAGGFHTTHFTLLRSCSFENGMRRLTWLVRSSSKLTSVKFENGIVLRYDLGSSITDSTAAFLSR
jgi:hypothetical protein